MLFLAHFSFSGRQAGEPIDGQEVSGTFSCLVDAGDVDEADRRLRALLRETRREHDLLNGVELVYLDALIAVKSVPKKGVIAYFAEHLEEMPDTIWTALPYSSARFCEAYGYGEDGEDDDGEAVPFLVFASGEGN